jgi:hypothetical protein
MNAYSPPVREKWIAQITFTDQGFGNYPPRTFTWEVGVNPDGNREAEALHIARNNWSLGRQWPWLVTVYCAEDCDNALSHTRSTYGMVSA